MDDAAPGQDGDTSDSSSKNTPAVVEISPRGEVVLDVSFETSKETIRTARKAHQAATRKPGALRIPEPNFSPFFKVAFRVELAVLQRHSKYFENLLGNTQFAEARLVQESLANLTVEQRASEDTDLTTLPWITITDDDEATRSIGRDKVFGDMLRILHGQPVQTPATSINMLFVTTLAILSDRFDCRSVIARSLSSSLKLKWPKTSNRALRADSGKSALGTEQVLRQKILVSWLLDQPMKLHDATREIILRGSSHWSALVSYDELPSTEAWWNLPDDLEPPDELQHRREAILNTIASVQRHFLALYSSRDRQCKLGYDSSSACDSFQLGQMLKFLTSKDLLRPVDFGPSSLEALPDAATLDIDDLLVTLKQSPSYQVDKNHTNCGLRTRLDPIVDFIRAMLSTEVVGIRGAEWRRDRGASSWARAAEEREAVPHGAEDRKFAFTRGMAGDQRLRYEGNMYADKMARSLFTADAWDWSPEY
ncbi:conserved hypothetical protein [Verticillium alfalfae VaMs.102]|uniref:BTB domain-containing protein n=1 Tax=Verticillium alfalfae (strain VaMs.102 / ATCC MYA-4576 / FGSC 10136) TaxID=526221 RepID=C9SKN8_VERA1|nr:conserved hypothetical protein [Verticillium alfalfae VaMs.102]EEY19256.1 conserved hypothetical protein [Verticillium alfalfae VaMs.102]